MPTQLDARLTEIEAALTHWRQVQQDTANMIVTLQRDRDRRAAGRRQIHVGPASTEKSRRLDRQGSRAAPIASVNCR
jgi:hemolysin activation/secretion protein